MAITEITCETCHKLKYMTYVLECGHIKCEACLGSTIGAEAGSNSCRGCNERDEGRISRNFLHEHVNLLSEIKTNFQKNNKNASCHLCLAENSYPPEFYCFEDSRYYCRAHFEIYNENNDRLFMRKTDILNDNFKMLTERRSALDPKCSEHKHCHADYVCCGRFICHRSKEANHKTHKSSLTSEAIEQAKIDLECEKESVVKRRNEVKRMAQEIGDQIDKQERTYKDESIMVENRFNEEIAKLEKERDKKLRRMEQENKIKLMKLKEERQSNEEDLQTVYRFENLTILTQQILPPLQQINHLEDFKKMLRNVTGKCYSETVQEPKLRIHNKPIETAKRQSVPPADRDKTSKLHSPSCKKRSAYIPSANTLIIQCPDTTKALCDVTTDENGNIYAADPIRSTILAFDASGKFNREIHVACASIQNLCYFSERLIFSCEDNKVYELSLNNNDKIKEVAEYFLFVRGRRFIKPHGMSTSVDGKLLYVCDQADSVVYILNDKLTKIETIKNIPSPIGIAVAPNSNVYVLCTGNILCVIDSKNEVRQVELVGNPCGRLGYMTANKSNQIMISDSIQRSIVIYDKEGVKVSSFVGYSQTERVTSPTGITVDRDNRLIVAEMENKQIKVYSNVQ